MIKSRKVGLVLLAPDVEMNRVVAVLRRRPKTDKEAGHFPENWDGARQVICKGEVGDDEEDDLCALQRIVSSQIGREAALCIFSANPRHLSWLSGSSGEAEDVLFYGTFVQLPGFLRQFCNGDPTLRGELSPFRQDEIDKLRDLEELGDDPFEVRGANSVIVMSSDEAEAVRFAFERLVQTH